MKAIILNENKTLKVCATLSRGYLLDNGKIYNPNEVEILFENKLEMSSVNWGERRFQIANSAMQILLSNSLCKKDYEQIAKESVLYADALINCLTI